DWVSDSEEESEPKDPQQSVPSFAQSSKHVKTPRHCVQPIETTIPAATPVPESPNVDHLIKDYDFLAKKMAKPTQKNYAHRGVNQLDLDNCSPKRDKIVSDSVIQRIDSINTAYSGEQPNDGPENIRVNIFYLASSNEIDEKDLELKSLPSHLEYAYLNGNESFPLIISSKISEKEKKLLLQVLENRKGAMAWKMSDITGIIPSFCTHKILMDDEFKLIIQPQRCLNPEVQDVVKNDPPLAGHHRRQHAAAEKLFWRAFSGETKKLPHLPIYPIPYATFPHAPPPPCHPATAAAVTILVATTTTSATIHPRHCHPSTPHHSHQPPPLFTPLPRPPPPLPTLEHHRDHHTHAATYNTMAVATPPRKGVFGCVN
nr:putative reverse transcriptase domain-containing protein [Tanacetum cinerariifolium]